MGMSTLGRYLAVVLLLFNLYPADCEVEPLRKSLKKWKEAERLVPQIQEIAADDIPSTVDIIHALKTYISTVEPEEEDVSLQCLLDTNQTVNDWPSQEYARQMLVSFGDLPEVILEFPATLTTKTYGNFDMCRAVEPGIQSFGGKYCSAHPAVVFNWGVCFPDSCTDSDVNFLVNQAALPLTGSAYTMCVPDDIPFSTGDYVAIVICSILAALMITGTNYDVIYHWKLKRLIKRSLEFEKDETMKQQLIESKTVVEEFKKKKPGYFGKFLMSFSVITNGRKLLSAKKGGSGSISALNGIRVISMLWIILGHSISFAALYYDNQRYLYAVYLPLFSYNAILGALFAVDTFFLLSGCLVSYLTLKHLFKTKGKMNWALFYFHRWWRLTPAFALLLLIWATLTRHIGNGPEHFIFDYTAEYCQNYWWAALLYFHNFYPWPGNTETMCMGWTWYLQVDMQLYIISPIFLFLIYKSFAIGTGVMSFFTVASIATVAGIATYYGYPMGWDDTPYNDNNPEGHDYLYVMPYARLQVYLVGLFLGYVLCKLNGKQIKLNKIVNIICWVLAIGMGLAIVYGVGPTYGNHPDQWIAVLYQSVSRFAFVVAVSWVIFACATGNGGPVNTLLSWNGWIPLSRLTYCAYLVHPILMFLYYWNLKVLIHYTTVEVSYIFIAHVVLSYMAAFVFSLAIESPMIGLEKLIFRR